MAGKRGRPRKKRISDGQIAFDEMDIHLEFYLNKKNSMLFVRLDDESLINPEGKIVEYRERYYQKTKSNFWDLSEKQRSVIRKLF